MLGIIFNGHIFNSLAGREQTDINLELDIDIDISTGV